MRLLYQYPLLFFYMLPPPPLSTLFPYTTLFRSPGRDQVEDDIAEVGCRPDPPLIEHGHRQQAVMSQRQEPGTFAELVAGDVTRPGRALTLGLEIGRAHV